jgi:hypothetical protein
MLRFVPLLILVASAMPAAAGDLDEATLRDYCRAEIAASGQVCDCLLRQFDKLTDGQQALVGAILRQDATAIPALRTGLTEAEARRAETVIAGETLLCRPSG